MNHISDHTFEEYLQYSPHLFVDVGRDTFNSSSSRQTTDCWTADVMEGIIQNRTELLRSLLALAFSFALSFCTSDSCTGDNGCLLPEFGIPVLFCCEVIFDEALFDTFLFTGISEANVLESNIHISHIRYLWSATNVLSPTDLGCKPHILAIYSHHLPMKGAEIGVMPKACHIGLCTALESEQGHRLPM